MFELNTVLSDCLTKRSANPRNLLNSVQTGWLKEIDSHPPFRSLIEHKAFLNAWLRKEYAVFRFSATCHVHAGAVVSCVLQQVRDVSQFMCMFLKSCWSLYKFVPGLFKSAGSNSSEKVAHNFPLLLPAWLRQDTLRRQTLLLCRSSGHRTWVATFVSPWLLVNRSTTPTRRLHPG